MGVKKLGRVIGKLLNEKPDPKFKLKVRRILRKEFNRIGDIVMVSNGFSGNIHVNVISKQFKNKSYKEKIDVLMGTLDRGHIGGD